MFPSFETVLSALLLFFICHLGWRLLQESISPTLYARLFRQYFYAKKVQTLNLSTKKFLAKLSYKKAARKMLVKSTPAPSSSSSFSCTKTDLSACSSTTSDEFVPIFRFSKFECRILSNTGGPRYSRFFYSRFWLFTPDFSGT